MRRCVCRNFVTEDALAHWGLSRQTKKNRSKEIKTRSMFNNAKQLLGTRSVWQQPNPFACFPIQTNLGTFYLFYNSIPLSLSKPPREKTCYVTLGPGILHLSEPKKNFRVPRRGENMCRALRLASPCIIIQFK